MWISKEALFSGSWSKLSTHALETCFLRNPHLIFCSSFQNLRLGGVQMGKDDNGMPKAQDDDITMMCMSNSHDDASMLVAHVEITR